MKTHWAAVTLLFLVAAAWGATFTVIKDRLGSIELGKLADFVVLSDDPTKLNADGIRKLKAEKVWIDGASVEA